MTITIEASPTLTLVIYPMSDRVVWIMGVEKRSATTNLEQALVCLTVEQMKRKKVKQ